MCRMVAACAEWCFLQEMPEQNAFEGVDGVGSDPEPTTPKRRSRRSRRRYLIKEAKMAAKQEAAPDDEPRYVRLS